MTASPNFDRLARPYRWLEYATFGPLLLRCRFFYLSRLANRSLSGRALVLGDGDGRFTRHLLSACPSLSADAVDISPAMVAALTRSARSDALRLTTYCADARQWQPAHTGYCLIVSHFFLDCLTTAEVARLTRRLTPAAAPGALWLVSEFATPPTPFGRFVARPLVTGLYRVFRLLAGLEPQTLPDYQRALRAAGWRLRSERHQLAGLLVSQLWQLKAPDPLD